MLYVFLVFEMFLIDEEQFFDIKWKLFVKEEDLVEEFVWVIKVFIILFKECFGLFLVVLEIFLCIGKEEVFVVFVLWIFVIFIRDYGMVKMVGEKRNLQCLFVMVKQLCVGGLGFFNWLCIMDYIMIIFCYIVEDEDIIC